MDERTAREVIEAIRSAVRALRAAEKALASQPSPVARTDTGSREANVPSPLLSYLLTVADQAKAYEEQDPQAFRVVYDPMRARLLDAVLDSSLYQVGPDASGFVPLDRTDAATIFGHTLAAIRKHRLVPNDVLAPLVDQPKVKHWADVDTASDLVFVRYETPAPVEVRIDDLKLRALLTEARKTPGSIEEAQGALAEGGVVWRPFDAAGQPNPTMTVTAVGRWVAVISVEELLTSVSSRLSVIEVDYDNQQNGWWEAAKAAVSLPDLLLPILRNQDRSVTCLREEVSSIEEWASSLPGWYEDQDLEHPTPLIIRNATADDILH